MTLGQTILDVALRKQVSPVFKMDVSFCIPAGFTILFGPSGAGKTTLLDCIAGLRSPQDGHVILRNAVTNLGNDRVLFDSKQDASVAVESRRMGYVFQTLALFPHLTVEENLHYGLARESEAERKRRACEILETFGIPHLLRRKPHEISGGERQRVALARSLVTNPAVLLLDEPLAALDRNTKTTIATDLGRWNQEHQIPILYVTHSHAEALALGERMISLAEGKVRVKGLPRDVLEPEAENWE